MLLLAALCTAQAVMASPPCDADPSAAREVTALYGDHVRFDVSRNGKTVGAAVTTFAVVDGLLAVDSRMRLDIRVLFVPVYSFDYHSQARWCGQRLQALAAHVDDDGTTFTLSATARDDKLLVDDDKGTRLVAGDLLPTDHWNAAVLGREAVLNTLTGEVNRVDIVPCTTPSPAVLAAAPGAHCHAYTGELRAQVYYDDAGRWVGLDFAGRDGSRIAYTCRDCRAGRAPEPARAAAANRADEDG